MYLVILNHINYDMLEKFKYICC